MNQPMAGTSPTVRAAANGGKTILVVEDDSNVAVAIAMHLNQWGYTVRCASDAYNAVVAARRGAQAVLLDFRLPGGSGADVLWRLKTNALTAGLPVILISAQDEQAVRREIRGPLSPAFLRKPIDFQALRGLLDHLFGDSGQVGLPDGAKSGEPAEIRRNGGNYDRP